jgi:hypothetical protein
MPFELTYMSFHALILMICFLGIYPQSMVSSHSPHPLNYLFLPSLATSLLFLTHLHEKVKPLQVFGLHIVTPN